MELALGLAYHFCPGVTSGSIILKNVGAQLLWKTVWNYLVKLIRYMLYNTELPFLALCLEKLLYT